MKLRLTLLFAVIALLGFTAVSKQRVKTTNAENVMMPSLPTEQDLEWMRNHEPIIESSAITLILDTERDSKGNALRRHVYIYQGNEDVLINNGTQVSGQRKVSRLSFPADEAGLAQWRKQLVRLFASKNEQLLTETEKNREKLQKGEINEEEYNDLMRKAQYNQAIDLTSCRPIVLIKPMGNAESGDVIDVFTVMNRCYISTFQLEDINHTDSVMVFNSLYPGKDMPNDVNLYTYGAIDNYPQEFDFALNVPKGFEDINNNSEAFVNEFGNNPILTIGVEAANQSENGAVANMMFDENKFKEMVLTACNTRKDKRNAERIFASKSFKSFVKKYGNSVKNPQWIGVTPADFQNLSNLNKFQKPLQEMLDFWEESRAIFFHNDELLIYTNRHTPYSALKCVIDNLRQIDITYMILAY